MDLVFAATLLLAFALLVRALPRIIWPVFMGSDIHYHYFLVREIREGGFRIPTSTKRVVAGPTDTSYPAYYHALLARLSPRMLFFVDCYGAIFFDLLAGGVISLILYYVAGKNLGVAILALALYLILPSLTFSALGPRAYSLTVRSIAQAITTIGLVALVMAGQISGAQQIAWFFVSFASFGFVFLSSQFGCQHLLFTLIAASFFGGETDVLLALLGGLAFAGLVGRRRFVFQVAGQLKHLEWYFKYGQSFVSNRGDWKRFKDGLVNLNIRAIVGEVLFHNPLLVGMTRSMPFFLALYLLLCTDGSRYSGMVSALLLGSAVPWMITSFGRFRVLGEAERYLEFSIGLAWFAICSVLDSTEIVPALFLVGMFSIVFCFLNFFVLKFQLGMGAASGLDEIGHAVEPSCEKVILCLNNSESYYFLNKTDLTVVGFNCNASVRNGYEVFFNDFFSVYPKVSATRVNEICRDYSVDFVLLNKAIPCDSNGIPYDLRSMRLVCENERYALMAPV